jgi:hypothetical protein
MRTSTSTRQHRWALLVITIFFAGCATVKESSRGAINFESFSPEETTCSTWFKQVDAVVDGDGARDFGPRRFKSFPYLRADRFLASFSGDMRADSPHFATWITQLGALGQKEYRLEIGNLSSKALKELSLDKDQAYELTRICTDFMVSRILSSPERIAPELITSIVVPDDYSQVKRIAGLYSFLQFPFSGGIDKWHEEATALFHSQSNGEYGEGSRVAYKQEFRGGHSQKFIKTLLKSRDLLGMLSGNSESLTALFQFYAPVFLIEETGQYDQIGEMTRDASDTLQLDVNNPTVYTQLSYTRFYGKTLLQLNYLAWMPERPKSGAADLLAGKFDGVLWRVTLDEDGVPLIYDAIHPCGCYHMFFPTARLEMIAPPDRYVEWAFSPREAMSVDIDSTITVTAETRTHYLANVSETSMGDEDMIKTYQLAPYDELRSMSSVIGARSIFDQHGLVPGTERGERFLFWPMGIRSAGAMRQWGTHATAFLGRRHFDDAFLIQERFKRR